MQANPLADLTGGSGLVDASDLAAFAACFGGIEGDPDSSRPPYDPACDFVNRGGSAGIVGASDLGFFAAWFGW
jgi:hypothetical protein